MSVIIKSGASGNTANVDANNQLLVNPNGYTVSNTSAAAWTSGTAGNTAVTIISGNPQFNTLLVTLNQTSTISGGAITVEGSNDNSNWIALQGVLAGAQTLVNTAYTLVASTYQGILYDVAGFQYVRVRLSTVITGSATVTVGYIATAQIGPAPLQSVQDAATAATAATAPTKAIEVGAVAATAYPTAVTNGQLIGVMSDKAGRPAVVLNTVRDLVGAAVVSNNSSASGVSFIGAGAAGVFNDIITLVLTNRSSTATVVSLTDGTATYTFALAGNGGVVVNFPTPLPATSSATAWTIGNSATVACDYIAVYAKNK